MVAQPLGFVGQEFSESTEFPSVNWSCCMSRILMNSSRCSRETFTIFGSKWCPLSLPDELEDFVERVAPVGAERVEHVGKGGDASVERDLLALETERVS